MDPDKIQTILNKRYIDFLIEWKNRHEVEYKECREGLERLGKGDYSMFEKLFSMAVGCVPEQVVRECRHLFGLKVQGDMTDEDDEFEDLLDILSDFDGYLRVFTGDEGLDMELVAEKDDSDATSHFIRIKGESEWWQSIPMQYRIIAQLALGGKPQEKLAHNARRTLIAACLTLKEMVDSLRHLAIEMQDPVLLGSLYYAAVEHGFVKITKQLGNLITMPGLAMFIPALIPAVCSKMTETSLKKGYDKKADWKSSFGKKDTNPDVRHAVLNAMDETQAKHGRHRVEQATYDIDNYLIGDKERLKEEILRFLDKMPCDNQIAYLWKSLDDTGHLTTVSFPDFHRALQNLWGKGIKYDRAQRLYTMLTAGKKEFNSSKTRAAAAGRKIIGELEEKFKKIA